MDLPWLLRHTTVTIHPIVILDMTTSVYDLEWKRSGTNVVEVGLEQSKKEVWLLRVEDPELILREPLEVEETHVPSSERVSVPPN